MNRTFSLFLPGPPPSRIWEGARHRDYKRREKARGRDEGALLYFGYTNSSWLFISATCAADNWREWQGTTSTGVYESTDREYRVLLLPCIKPGQTRRASRPTLLPPHPRTTGSQTHRSTLLDRLETPFSLHIYWRICTAAELASGTQSYFQALSRRFAGLSFGLPGGYTNYAVLRFITHYYYLIAHAPGCFFFVYTPARAKKSPSFLK